MSFAVIAAVIFGIAIAGQIVQMVKSRRSWQALANDDAKAVLRGTDGLYITEADGHDLFVREISLIPGTHALAFQVNKLGGKADIPVASYELREGVTLVHWQGTTTKDMKVWLSREGMKEQLASITEWMARNAPDEPQPFRPGASGQAVDQAENELGLALPDFVRQFYRLADGQTENAVPLVGAFTIMPLSEMVDAAGVLNEMFPGGINGKDPDHAPVEADAGVRAVWWSPQWVPVMTNGSGDYICLDLDPAQGGTVGQLVKFYHDETFRRCEATGLDALLERIASELASGDYGIRNEVIAKVRP